MNISSSPMTSGFGRILRPGPGDTSGLQSQHGHESEIRGAIAQSGAVLLRGFRSNVEQFEAFTDQLGLAFGAHPATAGKGRAAVTETTATVDAGRLAFPWHQELGYTPKPPDVVIFYADAAPTTDGQTYLTDGAAVFAAMSPTARSFAQEHRVRYSYRRDQPAWPISFDGANDEKAVAAWLTATNCELPDNQFITWHFDATGVEIQYVTPMIKSCRWQPTVPVFCNQVIFQVRRGGNTSLDDGAPIPEWFVDEAERLSDLYAYALRWRKGDLLLFDNSRIMHARHEINDPTRRILARVGTASF